MKSSLVLIANPAAKKASGQKIQTAARLFDYAGYDLKVFLTEKRGDAEVFARNASSDGAGFVIAAGGDGTINEVINGLAYTGTKMAILPLGTTNVLAKELGIPENIGGAVKRILNGSAHTVSLGKITFTHHASRITRYFCLMAGIGFDADAVYGLSGGLKRYSGKWAYIASGLRMLSMYSPERLTFIVDGTAYAGYSAIIGKASRYGGDFKATPDASITEPELYACIMHGKRRVDVLRYVYGIVIGRHLRYKDVTYLKTSSVQIDGTAHAQVDGEYLGTTPATVSVARDALKVVY
ncbi:MAG: diacylglycerol kinase family protein [Nitrospirota bacterium]